MGLFLRRIRTRSDYLQLLPQQQALSNVFTLTAAEGLFYRGPAHLRTDRRGQLTENSQRMWEDDACVS